MPNQDIYKKIGSIESVQFKILDELNKSKTDYTELVEVLNATRDQLIKSMTNEKVLLLQNQVREDKIKALNNEIIKQQKLITNQQSDVKKQMEKVDSLRIANKELEEKYGKLQNTKVVRSMYKYWDLRKKIGLKRK